MADKAFLDGEGLTQVVTWLRDKDVGQYTDESKTNEIFNDYSNNKAKGIYNHAEGYNTQALGAYNHAEGYGTMAGSYQDAYYRYCGNPILQIPNSTDVISKVAIDSNDYQISGKTGTFSLENIELPEDFTVGKYSSTLNIFNYDYIFKNNNNEWYTIQSIIVEMTDELKSLFTTLFENNSSINRKIYQVSAEPTEISDNLYIYNGAIYCSAFTDNKIIVSEDTINTLITINTLEPQTNGYITTIYVNESNYFGFVYDNSILFKQQWNTEYNITNLTNNYGTFKKIDKVYQSAPTIITQAGLVCGTSIDSTATPQYNGNSGKWEYLDDYNVVLSITEADRTVYDDEGNPTGEANPSLTVTSYNDETLINKTVDFATDTLNFIYSKNEEETFNWYLNDTIVNLADYGILVENQQEHDIITFELNKVYMSYDSEGNQIEKTQEEFYTDNHVAGTISYIFEGTEPGNWVKTIQDGAIGNSTLCHTEGEANRVAGRANHAEGAANYIYNGNYSHIEGVTNDIYDGSMHHIEGEVNRIYNGTINHAEGAGHYIYAGRANHAEGYGHHINENISNDYNSVRNYWNISDGNFASDICGGSNEVKSCQYTSVSGYDNTITNDFASVISGFNNKIIDDSGENIISGASNTLNKGEGNIISGNYVEVTGNHNIVDSQTITVNGSNNLISGQNTSVIGNCNIMGGNSPDGCNGDNNLIFGDANEINGDNNLIGGTGNRIYKTNSTDTVENNVIFGYINKSYSTINNIIGGTSNEVYNSNQFVYGTRLLSGNEEYKTSRTTLLTGEFNNNNFINVEYVLTKDTVYYDTAKIYYYIKNNEYHKIKILWRKTPDNSWYELINDEYIQTQDKEMIENKEYYYKYSDTDYRLIKIANTEITQPIYEIKQYIIIAGNGFNEDNRSNALELDYQGNLQTSGGIVNGDGVVLGAYISNEKIDEIWDSVFGGGRVCLVQTSS